MDLESPPDKFWHCRVTVAGRKKPSVVNDLNYQELQRTIVRPWLAGRPFTVSGAIVKSPSEATDIRIVHTARPQESYASEHNARMRNRGIADLATDRSLLPFAEGEDVTFQLLFEGAPEPEPTAEVALVLRLCERLPQAARILCNRQRKDKASFEITDEYDIQDLLHALLRGYLKHSVQEDPLPKVAGTKSGRADISIEDLGVLIEVKYVHGPQDQRRIFEDFSQDLLLYTEWPHLRTLVLVVYNSADLRDAEALERLAGKHEINGRQFEAQIVLA